MATAKRRHKRPADRRSAPPPAIPKLRIAVIAICVLAAAWLTVAVGAAGSMRATRPDFALRFMPADAGARAKSAELHLAQAGPTPASVRTAANAARAALRRDPTTVPAWRLLAVEAATRGQPTLASRLFRWSERLSRRDLPTQLGLIEDSVARNDIPGALRHYDVALRVSLGSRELLFPVLVGATAEPAIVPPLAGMLARNPSWRLPFLWALVESAPSDENLVRIFELSTGGGTPLEPNLAQALIHRLVSRERYSEAWRAFRLTPGGRRAQAGLRNGGFEQPNPIPPFDWLLQEGADLRAEQTQLGQERGQALALHAGGGQGGVAAQQLLRLPPGDYDLSAVAGALEDSAPAALRWTVSCAGRGGAVLLGHDIPPLARAPRAHRAAFRVPAGCPAQWLGLAIGGGAGERGGWIDAVAISGG